MCQFWLELAREMWQPGNILTGIFDVTGCGTYRLGLPVSTINAKVKRLKGTLKHPKMPSRWSLTSWEEHRTGTSLCKVLEIPSPSACITPGQIARILKPELMMILRGISPRKTFILEWPPQFDPYDFPRTGPRGIIAFTESHQRPIPDETTFSTSSVLTKMPTSLPCKGANKIWYE